MCEGINTLCRHNNNSGFAFLNKFIYILYPELMTTAGTYRKRLLRVYGIERNKKQDKNRDYLSHKICKRAILFNLLCTGHEFWIKNINKLILKSKTTVIIMTA